MTEYITPMARYDHSKGMFHVIENHSHVDIERLHNKGYVTMAPMVVKLLSSRGKY